MYKLKNYSIFFLVSISSWLTYAQDIEKIVKGEKLSLQGNIAAMQSINHAQGKLGSRKPFNYLYTGGLNLTLFGQFQLPFTFVYSNAGASYTQPTFKQNAIHPKYKWFQGHTGNISVSYSPHTVSGIVFKGAALDLTPGKFKFGAFYGNFQKAVLDTSLKTTGENVKPALKRDALGFNMGWQGKIISLDVNSIYAWDDSKTLVPEYFVELAPKKNLAYGIKTNVKLSKKIQWNSELSTSIFTSDTREKTNLKPNIGPITLQIPANSTTAMYKAMKQALQIAIGGGTTLNVNYERIDPGYQTLGAYYFNNDYENITGGLNFNLLKNKLVFNGNFGFQRDNLNHAKISGMVRKVGSANVNFTPGSMFNIGLNYSNFLSFTNIRPYTDYQRTNPEYLALDTLNFRQISQNMGMNCNLKLSKCKTVMQSINGNFTYQTAADHTGNSIQNGSAFLNAAIGYVLNLAKSGTVINIFANAGQNESGGRLVQSFSPVFGFQKTVFKKQGRFSTNASYTNSMVENKVIGGTLNLRSSLAYSIKKVHQLSMNFTYIQRKDVSAAQNVAYGMRNFKEYCLSVQYSANISFIKHKESNTK